jgi:glycosyltransferase involved in cell wall biosynthesis
LPTFKEKNAARDILSEKIGFKPNENCLWIGTIAELTKNKGIEYAIDGISKLVRGETSKKIGTEEIVYLIIGGGEEREALEKIREREKLEKTVYFVGEYRGASELLKAFDIFLLPSLKEGLPYTLLEAGAASLPTVATNVGGVTEIIEDMKSGVIIKSKRPREIAEAIGFLIEHPEKRKDFSISLSKTISENFTLERMIRETLAIYSEKL